MPVKTGIHVIDCQIWIPAFAGMTKDAIHPRARHGACWHMFVKNPIPEDQVLNLKIRPHRSQHQVGSV